MKLVEKCPNLDCAKNIPHFPKFPFPHLCPYCFHALDKAESNHPYSNAELEEVAYEVWKSTMIGQIFSLLQSHPDRFEMQLFSKNLKILVREMFGFDETPYGISKLTGISARNFSNWFNGHTKISMQSILNVIYVFNISPKQLLIDIESVEAGEIRSVKKLGFRQRVSKPANGLY